MAACKLRVELIRHTPAPEQLVALGARLCYASADLDTLRERIERADQDKFIGGVIESGHLSVLEHASFTFAVEGVSRVLLAQLTRHRIASFSVQSQRYVSKASGFDYVIPPSIAGLGEAAVSEYDAQMRTMHEWYRQWQERLNERGVTGEAANQDARFVLPNACETRLILTMNARELLHFFALRCCNRAQWEIRALADEMLGLCFEAAPALFDTAGPPCAGGPCPEGKRSCGRRGEAQARARALKKEKRSEHGIL